MAQTLDLAGAGTVRRTDHPRRPFGLFKDLERPGDVFRDLGPNWFASVMGTGIVANAAARPAAAGARAARVRHRRVGLAAAVLIALTAACAVHWSRYPERARAHAAHPVMAQFWGAPAMALMTVGAGTLVLGRELLGPAAVDADWVLWPAGTALGLVDRGLDPVPDDDAARDRRRGRVRRLADAGRAADGLRGHRRAADPARRFGPGRLTLLLACYAMFGISLFASVIIITQVWSRLVTHEPGPAVMVPTLWIVLGPLGQSVTAAGNLGTAAAHGAARAVRRGRGRVRAAVRRAGLGVRDDVAGAGRGDHDAHARRRRWPPVRADLVELHLPGRDVRDRDDRAGGPQPRRTRCGAPPSCCTPCCWWPGWWWRRAPCTAPLPAGCSTPPEPLGTPQPAALAASS